MYIDEIGEAADAETSRAGAAVAPGRQRRMTAGRKQDAVLRLLRGEPEIVACELGVTAADLSGWRDAFLEAGSASLKARGRDDRDATINRLRTKSACSLWTPMLQAKIERPDGHASAGRLIAHPCPRIRGRYTGRALGGVIRSYLLHRAGDVLSFRPRLPTMAWAVRREENKMRTVACAFAAFVLAPMSLCAEDVDLGQLRDLVSKYQDVNVALAEGYITPDNHCVSAAGEGLPAELGAMGIHFIHPELLQVTATEPRVDGVGTHTDWMRPAILIYEPQADGSLTLVAVENLVFEKAWKEAGNAEVPVLNGRTWDHMADDPQTPGDEAHGFAPHMDQHVWLFRDNPAGVLMPFNAMVSCEHHEQH